MNDDDLIIMTDLDVAHSIKNALHRLNCTFEDLNRMYCEHDFSTVRHKIAWYALRDYYDDRDYYLSLLEGAR